MRKSIAWILNFTSKLPNSEEKIKCLRQNDNSAIRTVLKYCYDPAIEWVLPEGEPPYTPCEFPHQENMLYQEARRLYLFIKGGNNNLKPLKRETMFLDILQSVDPEDAKLLLSIKDKKMPYPGLDKTVVLAAFPNLF